MDDKKPPQERDQELEVIRKLRKLLDPLSGKTRDRVMMYMDSYYEDVRMAESKARLDTAIGKLKEVVDVTTSTLGQSEFAEMVKQVPKRVGGQADEQAVRQSTVSGDVQ